MGLPLAVEADR